MCKFSVFIDSQSVYAPFYCDYHVTQTTTATIVPPTHSLHSVVEAIQQVSRQPWQRTDVATTTDAGGAAVCRGHSIP